VKQKLKLNFANTRRINTFAGLYCDFRPSSGSYYC